MVVFWQGSPNNQNKCDIHGSHDGHFAIDEAPLGDVDLFAVSEEYPRSEIAQVRIAPAGEASLELELPDPLTGRGRVVDALSGRPLPRAKIQLYSMYKHVMMRPWKAAQIADSNGMFEIVGFLSGENMIEVSAPGFATRQVFGFGVPGRVLDFDLVGLFSKQAVEVQLTSEAKVDFTQYRSGMDGPVYVAEHPFQADGVIRFSDLNPGAYTARVVAPDSSLMFDKFVLQPGKDVHIQIPLSARHLGVQVVPVPGDTIPVGAVLHVSFASGGRLGVDHYYRVSPDGTVDVARVEGSDVMLQVEEAEGAILAVEHVSLTEAAPSSVTIYLDDRSSRFRVIDGSGKRVAGARVTLTCPNDRSGWLQNLETDERGECSVRGLSFDRVFVNVYHEAIGVQPSVLVDLRSATKDPIELILAPGLELMVTALERTRAVPNIELRANDQQGIGYGLGAITSNFEGVVNWRPVGRGDYKIQVQQPGYWPSEQEVHLTDGSSAVPIQVRRVGNIDIGVKNNYETAVPGVSLDLFSIEEARWVSSWIQSGMIAAAPSALTTGADGHVRINALPNGAYRWRATVPGNTPLEGDVVIAPQSTTPLLITLP